MKIIRERATEKYFPNADSYVFRAETEESVSLLSKKWQEHICNNCDKEFCCCPDFLTELDVSLELIRKDIYEFCSGSSMSIMDIYDPYQTVISKVHK